MSDYNEKKSSSSDSSFGKILDKKYIRNGVILFFFITILSFSVLFFYQNTNDSISALSTVKVSYILLALCLAFLDWLIGGFRNHIFIRLLKKGISWKACFEANLANIFMGAVTPSQTGGGPAQMYMLWRHGIKLSETAAVSIINYVSTVIFFLSSASLSIYFLKGSFSSKIVDTLVTSGFSLFAAGMALILFSLFFPKLIGQFIIWIAGKISLNWKKKAALLSDQLISYNETMRLFITRKPWLLPASLLITTALYLNKYVIAYVLLLGLGVEAPFWTVIGIQALIFFMLYFAPSPGASGIAEVSIAAMMSGVMSASYIPSFTILHRVFLLMIPALLGSFVFLRKLKSHTSNPGQTAS